MTHLQLSESGKLARGIANANANASHEKRERKGKSGLHQGERGMGRGKRRSEEGEDDGAAATSLVLVVARVAASLLEHVGDEVVAAARGAGRRTRGHGGRRAAGDLATGG